MIACASEPKHDRLLLTPSKSMAGPQKGLLHASADVMVWKGKFGFLLGQAGQDSNHLQSSGGGEQRGSVLHSSEGSCDHRKAV